MPPMATAPSGFRKPLENMYCSHRGIEVSMFFQWPSTSMDLAASTWSQHK